MTLALDTGGMSATAGLPLATKRDAVREVYARAAAQAANFFGIPQRDLLRARGTRPPNRINRARRVAIYLTVMAGHSACSVAPVVGMTHQGVSRTLRTVEELRDDRKYDLLLDLMAEEIEQC